MLKVTMMPMALLLHVWKIPCSYLGTETHSCDPSNHDLLKCIRLPTGRPWNLVSIPSTTKRLFFSVSNQNVEPTKFIVNWCLRLISWGLIGHDVKMTGDIHVRPRRCECFQRYLRPPTCLLLLKLKWAQQQFACHTVDFSQNILDITL
jgi:hypothetical protein